jgi:FkbM family methyltransferase
VPSLRFRGWRVETDAPTVTPRIVAQIFWGVYESAELRFVERHLRRDLDVVELGSSIGAVSSAIAQRQDPERRLLCVEANPDLVPVLRRNVARNAPGHRVEVVHAAVAYGRESVPFASGPTSVSGRVASGDAADTREVPARSLSRLLAEHAIGDFALVSDVEGAEAAVIEHDARALAACRQIVIELHETRHDGRRLTPDDLCRALVEVHGFRLRHRRGPVCVLDREADR